MYEVQLKLCLFSWTNLIIVAGGQKWNGPGCARQCFTRPGRTLYVVKFKFRWMRMLCRMFIQSSEMLSCEIKCEIILQPQKYKKNEIISVQWSFFFSKKYTHVYEEISCIIYLYKYDVVYRWLASASRVIIVFMLLEKNKSCSFDVAKKNEISSIEMWK
jgi:hypothetical protein